MRQTFFKYTAIFLVSIVLGKKIPSYLGRPGSYTYTKEAYYEPI